MSTNVHKQKLRPTLRRTRVIALAAEGYTQKHIADKLNVNEKTIRRDIQNIQITEIVNEIQRRQIADIEAEEESRTRMHYRDKLLEKLIPKPTPQINIQQNQHTEVKKVEFSYEQFGEKYGRVFAEQLLREESEDDRTENGSDPKEPLHSP